MGPKSLSSTRSSTVPIWDCGCNTWEWGELKDSAQHTENYSSLKDSVHHILMKLGEQLGKGKGCYLNIILAEKNHQKLLLRNETPMEATYGFCDY